MMKHYVYVDTETTGLKADDELLSVSVLDDNQTCLFHSLIKPETKTEWTEAMKINGISPAMVKNAPCFSDIKEFLRDLFRDKDVVAYNMAFDSRFLDDTLSGASSLNCCMEAYAEYIGEPDTKHGNVWKWHKLINATEHCDPDFKFKAHDSLEDCKATRVVWHYLLEQAGE
jgi:DNA polymerase-3 subunit epsilon